MGTSINYTLIDAPAWVDLLLLVVFCCTAFVQYVWIAQNGHSIGRWLQAVGWSGLIYRFTLSLMNDGNVPISSIGMAMLAMIAGGTVLTAVRGR